MKTYHSTKGWFILIVFSLFSLAGCLSPRKFDSFVSSQFNDQLPKLAKKNAADITVSSVYSPVTTDLSTTVRKTSKVVPLIVYWSYDYRHTCTLNPLIAVNNFTNTVNSLATKTLAPKIAGKKLELNVEQVPNQFALVDKAHIIWIVYAISWDKIYMEPDFKDLVVSYKLIENGNAVKTGKITVKNNMKNKGLRFFQSWKSAVSEHLGDYNVGFTNMTRSFVNQLGEEL
jgi:hypothetical protein